MGLVELGLSSLGFFDWSVEVDGLCSAVVVLFSVTDIDLSVMFSSPLQVTRGDQTDTFCTKWLRITYKHEADTLTTNSAVQMFKPLKVNLG